MLEHFSVDVLHTFLILGIVYPPCLQASQDGGCGCAVVLRCSSRVSIVQLAAVLSENCLRGPACIRRERSWAGDQQLPRCCCSFPQNCPGERRRHSLGFLGDCQITSLVLQCCSCLMFGLCLHTVTLLLSSSHSEEILPGTCTLPDLGSQVLEGISRRKYLQSRRCSFPGSSPMGSSAAAGSGGTMAAQEQQHKQE